MFLKLIFLFNANTDKNNLTKLSDTYNNLNIYQNNSKSKKEEDKSKYIKYLGYKNDDQTKKQNISNNYHSYENKNTDNSNKFNIRNSCRNTDSNNVNLKYIKLKGKDANTPKIDKPKGYIEHKITGIINENDKNDLSKTYHYKDKINYGYREIRDVKKNKNIHIINKNNCKQENNNYNNSKEKLKDGMNFNYFNNNIHQFEQNNASVYNIRSSLNLNNNKNIIINNYKKDPNQYNNNSSYKVTLTNPNIKNYPNINLKENSKFLKNKEQIFLNENNFLSYKNINNSKIADRRNQNNDDLTRTYTSGSPRKEYKTKMVNSIKYKYYLKNDKINNNDTDNMNNSRYNSSEFKESSTEMITLKNKYNNGHNNYLIKKETNPKINFGLDPLIKINYTKNIKHEKKNSATNHYNTINTEKIYLKNMDKYYINGIFKVNNNINNNKKEFKENKPQKNSELDNKSSNTIRKLNSKNKNEKKSVIVNQIYQTNKKHNIINNNNSAEKQKIIRINNKYYKINNNENSNIYNLVKTGIKEPHKKLSTKNCEIYNIYNYRFKTKEPNILSNSKENQKTYQQIRKHCKSLEKTEKGEINKKLIFNSNNHRKLKTKSKSKRKHSKCIKYIDNLKIFKFSEISYNINNEESSTNYTKNSNFGNKYRKYMLKSRKSLTKEKRNINSFNLHYKTYEEDFKIKNDKIQENSKFIKPQISCRITLSKKNNIHIKGIERYFKVNYYCSENLRNEYDADSEDTSEYYNKNF